MNIFTYPYLTIELIHFESLTGVFFEFAGKGWTVGPLRWRALPTEAWLLPDEPTWQVHRLNYIILISGLEHEFYDFPCVGNVIIPLTNSYFSKGLKPPISISWCIWWIQTCPNVIYPWLSHCSDIPSYNIPWYVIIMWYIPRSWYYHGWW